MEPEGSAALPYGQPLHMIVLPGGSYVGHAPHEAEPIVEWLNGAGIEATVFRYPVRTRHPGPTHAIQDEIKRVRKEGARRVGLIGFSAGGHAAGLAAAAGRGNPELRVDLLILGYPVVSMLLDTHRGSRENLIGPTPTTVDRQETSLEMLVDRWWPPTFGWHTANDAVVPPHHSYLLGAALSQAGVPHEMHVFREGSHGLGLAHNTAASEWTLMCEQWLLAVRNNHIELIDWRDVART